MPHLFIYTSHTFHTLLPNIICVVQMNVAYILGLYAATCLIYFLWFSSEVEHITTL